MTERPTQLPVVLCYNEKGRTMQTLANIGQFEQLQAAANAAMGCSGLGVFNDHDAKPDSNQRRT